MSEIELLNRCEIKAQDPVAKFMGRQVKKLYSLADMTPPPAINDDEEYNCSAEVIQLIAIIRNNLQNLEKHWAPKKNDKTIVTNQW